MCRILDDTVYGVLNDLDLSSLREHVNKGTRTSFQRTGTPPYMAIELLRDAYKGTPPIRHLYRHDLESFAYVILILCSINKFNQGTIERLLTSPFDEWLDAKLSWDELSNKKRNYLESPISVATAIHSSFHDFIPWLEVLLSAFKLGFSGKKQWEAEVDTYNLRLKTQSVEVGGSEVKGSEAEDLIFNSKHGAGDLVGPSSRKPPPFNDDTLGGHIDYNSLVRSLRTFGTRKLLYRNKD